jgi:small subunit ribosomal protein S27e
VSKRTYPISKFLKVKCADCGNIQTIFDRTDTKISCSVCGATMALPAGGKADIKGEVVGRADTDMSRDRN